MKTVWRSVSVCSSWFSVRHKVSSSNNVYEWHNQGLNFSWEPLTNAPNTSDRCRMTKVGPKQATPSSGRRLWITRYKFLRVSFRWNSSFTTFKTAFFMVLVRVDDFCSLLLRSADVPPMNDSLFALTPPLDGARRESVTILAKVFLTKTRELSSG